MRTKKRVSVPLSPDQPKIAKKENRTTSEPVRRELRRYEEAVRLLREDAREKGTDRLTMREVEAEIGAARRNRATAPGDGLTGADEPSTLKAP